MSGFELILVSGVALSVPIIWAALGETLAESGGVINIGIEGAMLIGACAAAIAAASGGALAGLAAALTVGLATGALFALLYVYLGLDQIITGFMFNIFALGLTTTIHSSYLSGKGGSGLGAVEIPLLNDLPLVGTALFSQNILLYLAIVAAVAIYFCLRHSWFGLSLRAAGEDPEVLAATGRSVRTVRAVSLLGSGALVAVGGAALLFSTAGQFVPGITNGRGFIALAVVVLARWNPLWVIGGCLLFGISQGLAVQADSIVVLRDLPRDVVLMLPYVITILAVLLARGSRYPRAIGIPFKSALG